MNTASEFDKFIERLIKIRRLSTPSIEGIDDADAYSRQLRENFLQIGRLAAENRAFLDEILFPLILTDKVMSDEETEIVSNFIDKLLDPVWAENLDLPIAYIVSDKLLRDAMTKEDVLPKLRSMDLKIAVCYTMMNMTERIREYPEIFMQYQKEGLSLGQIFLFFRGKDEFNKLDSEEARDLVLTNARYMPVFYEDVHDRDTNELNLELLREARLIADDPFYIDRMTDFDWQYYRLRVLTYFAQLTDFANVGCFEEDQFPEICARTEELYELWHSDPDFYSEFETESYIRLHCLKNRYYAGKISAAEYKEGLLELYHNRRKNEYDVNADFENIQIPIELISVMGEIGISKEDDLFIRSLFDNVIAYMFHMPNSGSLTFMLELGTRMLDWFVEVPGGPGFEDIMLNYIAALHPPTYVHSQMVAQFSVCLCGHLIDTSPEILTGVCGCDTAEAVVQKRDEILDFVRHAALCHDAGKIYIIDTIFVYGRKLLDMEFELIKTHSKSGAELLKRFPSTEKYADVALGHHKWYDNSRGYPEEFDARTSPIKPIIDIVTCADCLDAATDTIGRSYSRGKTFDELYDEICEGAGTRYAPWLPELLSGEDIRKDIEFLLAEGRDRVYRDTYRLLKSVHNKEN